MRFLYAVSNWIYGEEALDRVFAKLKRLGYDGIELTGEPGRYVPKAVNRLCSNYGLKVLSIAGIYPWPTAKRDLSNPDPFVRERAIGYLRRCCEFAAELGAPLVVVVPAAVGRTNPIGNPQGETEWDQAAEREWGYAIDSVREAACYAEATGVLLAIEPINRYETFLVNTAEQGQRFISEVGSNMVKLHLDTFHMNIEEKNLAEAIRRSEGLLVNLHVADSNRQAVGRGHIDFGAIIEALYDIDYQGAVVLEPLLPVANPYKAISFPHHKKILDTYLEESIQRLKQYEVEIAKKGGSGDVYRRDVARRCNK